MILKTAIEDGENSLGVLSFKLREQAALRSIKLDESTDGFLDLVVGTPSFIALHERDRRINARTSLYTMLESPAVPLCLVPAVVSSRQVIVPSNANAISISASMPAASVQVCGYGFSPAEFVRRFDTPYESSTVVFGSVFDWKSSSGDRKNIRAMVRAFESAFMPDRYKNKVKLVLCCAEIPDFLSCNSNPQIEVLPGWKSRDSIVQTIASFDCGVYVPAYEGYGIAALETLASGKPLITHSLSGHSEFVPVSDSFIVKCSTTKARGAYQGLGFWYEPDSASYIEAFRTAFNLGKTLPSIRGVAAGKKISSLTWANSFNRLIELVKP